MIFSLIRYWTRAIVYWSKNLEAAGGQVMHHWFRSWQISWVSPLLLFLHWSPSPVLSTSRSSPLGSQERNGSFLEKNPLSTHFCTKMKFSPTSFDFMGVWIRKADLSSSCLIISTDQSHTNKVLVILKHLYGNFRFAKTGKRISSFKSPQINPNENYFKSLNLTGGEWQLLFPTLDITQTSSCSTTNLHSQVWS